MGNACSNEGVAGSAPGEQKLEASDQAPVVAVADDDSAISPAKGDTKVEDTDGTPAPAAEAPAAAPAAEEPAAKEAPVAEAAAPPLPPPPAETPRSPGTPATPTAPSKSPRRSPRQDTSPKSTPRPVVPAGGATAAAVAKEPQAKQEPQAKAKAKSKAKSKAKAKAAPAAGAAAAKQEKAAEAATAPTSAPAPAAAPSDTAPAAAAAAPKKVAAKKKPAAPKENEDAFYKLNINIRSARGLRNADDNFGGTSDPFVICEVTGKPSSRFQTKVINETTEPVWNCIAELSGVHVNDSISFTVYDKDTFTAKDLLGKITMSHRQFVPSGFDGELKLLDTAGDSAVAADSYLSVKVVIAETTAGDRKTVKCVSKKIPNDGKCMLPKDTPRLMVSLINAKGLRNADWGGVSDPYAICEVPGKPMSRIITPVVADKLDPEWNYTKQIVGWEPGDSLSVAVFDKDVGKSDDLLGRVSIPAEKIYPVSLDAEVALKDAGKGHKATLRLKTWTELPDDTTQAK